MKNNKRLNKNNQVELLKYEQCAFRKIFEVIKNQGYECDLNDIEYDIDWGWIALAGINKGDFGFHLRRIMPFQLGSKAELSKAAALQQKLRRDLVEVYPYVMKADKNRNMKVELLKPLFNLS